MRQVVYKYSVFIVISTLLFFVFFLPVLVNADDSKSQHAIKEKNITYNNENDLELASKKLSSAIENYKKGDLNATKRDLDISAKLLSKASQTSNSKKSRDESRKLSEKINAFTKKLNQSTGSNENSIMRFWHHTTAIITREIDHLTHSYITLATSEKTLKYILDAKMYLYKAEHDLLVSHDSEQSTYDLDNTINSLNQANDVSIPSIRKKIIALSSDIHSLKEKVLKNQKAWLDNDEIVFLEKAEDYLKKAKEKSSPQIRLRFKPIEDDILSLRTEIERFNIKNNYESAMEIIKNIIKEL